MRSALESLCAELGIPTQSCQQYLVRHRERYPPRQTMLKSMMHLDWLLGNNVVLIGGLSVVPELRGYRQMRKTSNDLDLITDERGVYRLREIFGSTNEAFFRSEEYGDICFDFDSVPCSVDVVETHGWRKKRMAGEFREIFGKQARISPMVTDKSERLHLNISS